MGNAVAVFNPAQVPAHIRARGISETAKALMGNVGGGKKISIRGSVFRMMDGSKEIASVEERYLDVVILKAAKISRVWYAKEFDADATAAPDCWSADGDNPAPEVAEPQASRCADCVKNIAGSGKKGNSRACRYQQRVALLLADDLEGDVYQLVVPAASLFGDADGDKRPLQAYAKYLVAQKLSPEDVVTRLRFDTAAESPKLFFKPMRWVDPDTEVSIVTEKAMSEEAAHAVEMHVAPQQTAAPAVEKELGERPKKKAAPVADDEPAPPPKKKAAPVADDDEPAPPPKKKAAPVADDDEPAPPPKKKAAPVADDEDEPPPPPKKKAAPVADDDDDAAEPPAKRASAPKKPAVADKKDLASMVSDWDDE